MEILLKSSEGIVRAEIESELLSKRKLFLEGEITSEKASAFIKEMMILAEDPWLPIQVFINSPGGLVRSGMMIADCIRTCGISVDTVVLEQACSIAALILAAGTGRRQVLPHSKVLIHKPYVQGNVQINHEGMVSFAENMKKEEEELVRMMAGYCSKSFEEMDQAMNYDHGFNAEEAVEFGLADEVTSFKEL